MGLLAFDRRNMRRRVAVAATIAFVAAALSGCASAPPDTSAPRVTIDGRPNGIAIRASDGATFVTDDASNAVLVSTDGAHFVRYAALPVVGQQANSLSQVVLSGDHELFVARFGFGSAGAIFDVVSADKAIPLTGLDTTRRRLGLAVIDDHTLLSTWFVKLDKQPLTGGVSLITFDVQTHEATERVVVTGLGKPVGIAVSQGTVFVSDQMANHIVRVKLDTLLQASHPQSFDAVVAQVDGPDLLTVDAQQRLYTKCGRTGFCAIGQDGNVSTLANDFTDARGAAIDSLHKQIDVVDRAKSSDAKSDLRRIGLGDH